MAPFDSRCTATALSPPTADVDPRLKRWIDDSGVRVRQGSAETSGEASLASDLTLALLEYSSCRFFPD